MLRDILSDLPAVDDPNLLVGHAGADDAGVYRLSDDSALVLTVDFFTPVVDDAYDFGRVAATNSLSDVYAMGGRPLVALNIAAFPEAGLPREVIADVLRGGAQVAKEAGVAIAGGHTVADREIKYGLCVIGLVDPNRIIENSGAEPGQVLILTKPLGTGILATAVKADDISTADYDALVASMTRLNRDAADAMLKYGASAATDITGNGLLGHAYEIAKGSDVILEFSAAAIPILPGTYEAIDRGHVTGGEAKNRRYVEDGVEWSAAVDKRLEHVLYDPQTSGGLLMALPEQNAAAALEELARSNGGAAIVGRVVAGATTGIRVAP